MLFHALLIIALLAIAKFIICQCILMTGFAKYACQSQGYVSRMMYPCQSFPLYGNSIIMQLVCVLSVFQCLLNGYTCRSSNLTLLAKLSTLYMHTAKSSKTSKKGKKKQTAHTAALTPDHTHLTFGHHKTIIAVLALLPHLLTHSTHAAAPSDQSESLEGVGGASKSEAGAGGREEGLDTQMNLLLIGLGGGALPMFINKCIPNVSGFSCVFV